MTSPRMGWLDGLRGYAALIVVCFHLSPMVLGPARHARIYHQIDLGKYGVLLFFLVSGYVIPMSLERHGSLRRFWIGRLFRIYPAYLASIGTLAVLSAAGLLAWHSTLRADPVSAVLAHVTMLSDPLGMRGAVRVFWTLSYEMVFYLVVSGLFAWRLHRHSGWWAAGLALTALLAGPALPDGLLLTLLGGRRAVAAVLVVVVVGCVAAFLGGRPRIAGLAGMGFILVPALDAHPSSQSMAMASWQGLLLVAVMFAGTVVFRVQHAQTGRWPATLALIVVGGCLAGAHWRQTHSSVWPVTVTAVAATFGLAFALRGRRVPRMLRFLGTVSYSMYVLHLLVLMLLGRALPGLADRTPLIRAGAAVVFLVVTLVLAWASYRLVELPGQALGRRIMRRLEPAPIAAAPGIATQRAAARTGRGENVGASV